MKKKLKLRLPSIKGRAVYRNTKRRASIVIKKGEGRWL